MPPSLRRMTTVAERGRPPVATPKRNIMSIRGSEAWRDWLGELADHVHMPGTTLVDQALMHYAESKGFKKPMPKR